MLSLKKTSKYLCRLGFAFYLATLTSLSAISTSTLIDAEGPLGFASGRMTYTVESSTQSSLIFDLTNTSTPENGGYLTAFVFNTPDAAVFDTFDFFSNIESAMFSAIVDNGKNNSPTKAEPYGNFDLGASSTSQFLGGGSPTSGLPVGGQGIFTFNFTGSALDLLDVQSFIDAGAAVGGLEGDEFFVARFRGFEDGGSNKSLGKTVEAPDNGSTIILLGIGFIMMALPLLRGINAV